MTKPDAINLLRFDSRGSVQQHKELIARLFKHARVLQDDYKIAETPKGKRLAQSFYFKTLAKIDAHLTLINR